MKIQLAVCGDSDFASFEFPNACFYIEHNRRELNYELEDDFIYTDINSAKQLRMLRKIRIMKNLEWKMNRKIRNLREEFQKDVENLREEFRKAVEQYEN